jgi:hypothetical protein
MKSPRLVRPLRRNRLFRRLFIGLLMSRTGDAFTVVALSWLMLSIAGPAQLGLMLFLTALPAMVTGSVAGQVIDTVGLRVPVVADNLVRAVLTAGLAVLVGTGRVEVVHLFAFALLSSLVGALSDVGLEVAVPAVVEDEDLEEANTLLSVVWDVSALVGPVVAGLLVAWRGSSLALAVDAVSFLFVAATATSLPARAGEEPADAAEQGAAVERGGRLRALARGYVLLARNRAVLTLTVTTVAILAIAGAQEVFYPVFVSETLELDSDAYGLLVSVSGGLSLAGTILLTPVFRRWRPVWALSVAVAARGALLLPVAGARGLPSATFWSASSTALDGPYYPLARAQSQRLVAPEERGAVTGARASLGVAGYPLGNALGGLLLAGFSGPVLVAALAVCHLPLVALLWLSRSVRALPAPREPARADALPEAAPVG